MQILWPSLQQGMTPDEILLAIAGVFEQLQELGTVSLGSGSGVAGDLNAQYLAVTTNATANTESAFTHKLGRKPSGYIVVKNGNGGVVYDGISIWTSTAIYLKCTTASNAVTLLIF